MKTKQQLKIGLALFSAVLFLSFTSLKADVMGKVEKYSIAGGVNSYTISKNGKYVYAATLKNLYVQTRDVNTGKLTGIQTIPLPNAHFGDNGIIASPDGGQVYISIGKDILRYDIDSTGNLTYQKKYTLSGRSYRNKLLISENGKFLYAGYGKGIYILKRFSNGDLKEIGSTDINLDMGHITTLKFGPKKDTLYSADAYTDNVYVFKVDKNNGSLTNIQILPAGGYGITMTKDGKFFYSTKRGKEAIYIYNRNKDGKLTPNKIITNIPAPTNTPTQSILFGQDNDIIISPNQKYVYTRAFIKANVAVWSRDADSGDLTYLDRLDNISSTYIGGRLKPSNDGKHLYLDSGSLRVFDLRNDLSLVKSGPSNNVAPNGTISYTLAVTNNGPSDARNVVITDTLPAGTTFISGTHNNTNDKKCTASGQKVTCDMGHIANGDNYNAIIQVKAPASEGNITNTATVTSDQLDTVTANNTDTAKSTIKKGGSSLPPVKDGGSKGGGSLPLGLLLLLIPALLRRARVVS